MASLEYNVETALLGLLNGSPELAILNGRHAEYSGDREAIPGQSTNKPNPNLAVQAQKSGLAILQSCYFNVDCDIRLWIDVDEQTAVRGIDDLFHQVESILDDPALHITINAAGENDAYFICEGSRARKDVRTISPGRYQRTYQVQLICVAKV